VTDLASDNGSVSLTTLHKVIYKDALGHSRFAWLRDTSGEPISRRLELCGSLPKGTAMPLVCFAHVTDLHLADVLSPGRFEFFERFHGLGPEYELFVPSHRPQEFLGVHAIAAMLYRLNQVTIGPNTGRRVDFVMFSGDCIDNAQYNELKSFLGLVHGEQIKAFSASGRYTGVQSLHWPDLEYWHPENIQDFWKERYDFPAIPGIIDEAEKPISIPALQHKWYVCIGNHDGLILGNSLKTDAMQRILKGSNKAAQLPPDITDLFAHADEFTYHPELFLAGPKREIEPDESRYAIGRKEFISELISSKAYPRGHGFMPDDIHNGKSYYCIDDIELIRIIVLDTANPCGSYNGSIGQRQFFWLEQRLKEVHSRYVDENGKMVSGDGDDRLVIIVSHHNLDRLNNGFTYPQEFCDWDVDLPRVLEDEVKNLLHRFPNVIAMVNGHIHRHRVVAHKPLTYNTNGFWEITTASIVDWPSQARVIEVVLYESGHIGIISTIIDHAAPASPSDAEGLFKLASYHRVVSANDPQGGYFNNGRGSAMDRNVELILPIPFEHRRKRLV